MLSKPDRRCSSPLVLLAEIQRLIGGEGEKENDETELVFRHTELDAVFEVHDVRLTTRLLKGPFPDYQRLVPAVLSEHVPRRARGTRAPRSVAYD